MMRTVLTVSLLLVVAPLFAYERPSASARASDGAGAWSAAGLAGVYGFSHRFGGTSFTLTADGKYKSESGSCTTSYASEGTFKVEGGVIVVTVNSSKQWPNGQPEEATDVDAEAGEKDGAAKQTVLRLVPVAWGARLYLVEEGDLKNFCNAVNSGTEPRRGFNDVEYLMAYGDSYFGSFYLRAGDEERDASGLPRLPEGVRDYLLEKPVEGTVMNLEAEGAAVVYVGANHGLKPEMRLYRTADSGEYRGGPSLFSGLVVTSVGDVTVRVELGESVAVGDKVSTKFKPRKYE